MILTPVRLHTLRSSCCVDCLDHVKAIEESHNEIRKLLSEAVAALDAYRESHRANETIYKIRSRISEDQFLQHD